MNISSSRCKLILLANALTKNLSESVLNRDERSKYFVGLARLYSTDGEVEQNPAQYGDCQNQNGLDVVTPTI